ncbi:MAG: HDOD domain-containing protein [Candidatus Thiodiazotropha sp. (ex Dulcina madagascariensis)]|nr:HDOD domain-containing protein [Candidatus Thiodiazotropha sp. (ex Dulcina madagascariensis)]MCU7927038.1 HDOD domain-containing protein [Candidatus Thiodiazotropha sp. (ex Dulcina madagascariensis)]
MSTLWEKVTNNCKLISLPQAYLQLKAVIDDPEYQLEDVADAIRNDPALTTRVLKLVNSPYFGLSSRIDTVFRAVTLLGTQQIHDLALATSVAEALSKRSSPDLDMHLFWRRSVYCGLCAQALAQRLGVMDSERLFVSGLLFDLGHMILYQSVPELAHQALLQSQESQWSLVETEREVIGLDYAHVGATLMRHWRLPECLIETNECHPEPIRAWKYPLETAMVHIASLLATAYTDNGQFGSGALQPHPAALEKIGLSLEACAAIGDEIEPELDAILYNIYPLDKAS